MLKHSTIVHGFATACVCVSSFAYASDWPSWRGPDHNGTSTEQGLPSSVDPAEDTVWSAEMPGSSSATPIVVGDRVFVVSNSANDLEIYGICLDNANGAVLWQKLLDKVESVPSRNTMASCSPVSDGETVYFLSGTGRLYAYDIEGNEKWAKNLPEHYGNIGQQFGYSSSPLLIQGKLYLPILRGQWEQGRDWGSYTDKDSHVVCLDAATGAEVWKVHRPSEAQGESFDSYASAVPYQAESGPAIVVQGGDMITAHDAATGKELWRQHHNVRKERNWRLIPSPVTVGDVVIGLEPRGGAAFGVIPDGDTDIAYDETTWIYSERTADVPTPAVYDGNVYIVNGTRRSLICLDPKTGTERWQEALGEGARIWASPTIGDGKVYCLDENGKLTIASIADGFKLLPSAEFGGAITKSSIAIANGSLYVRTAEKLYRVSN